MHERLCQIQQMLIDDKVLPEDIWNLDETALLYRTTCSRSFVTMNSDGRGVKRSKERITATPIVSAVGEKFNLQVIGKSKNPRALKGVNAFDRFGILYHYSKKAWQVYGSCKTLYQALNKLAKARKRKFVLLVDNCSSHIKAAILLDPAIILIIYYECC